MIWDFLLLSGKEIFSIFQVACFEVMLLLNRVLLSTVRRGVANVALRFEIVGPFVTTLNGSILLGEGDQSG